MTTMYDEIPRLTDREIEERLMKDKENRLRMLLSNIREIDRALKFYMETSVHPVFKALTLIKKEVENLIEEMNERQRYH